MSIKRSFSCLHRCVDAGNIEALLWTATALGLDRLTTGCTQYLLSRDVLSIAPAQVPTLEISPFSRPQQYDSLCGVPAQPLGKGNSLCPAAVGGCNVHF